MSDPRLVEVFRAKDGIEANLVKNSLEDAGIRARIEGDLLQGAAGLAPSIRRESSFLKATQQAPK